MSDLIKGISVCNPVDIDRDYLLFTVDYAIENGFDHFQIIGPIHSLVKGNIDGMINYRKYSRFNNEKDREHVAFSEKVINEACEKASSAGIKTFLWHHELFIPNAFKEAYPEVLNDYGDIEVSHPLVRDFLENKIIDFFDTYPKMNGIILTLHETQIPLLKLKNQKLDKVERVKHVTKILYDACASLGKELIVRPFASLEEDYIMMTKAYEEISKELMIMDKWTQFDWSLTMPSNQFYNKIQNNPIFVEADIFGEFFGKGRLPLMLKKHIADKVDYCSRFNPRGYVARIDRNGEIPFGDVNEVNLNIMSAHLNGKNPEDAISEFFLKKYPRAASDVRELMEQTEDILIKTIYINGYLFSELSLFPSLNHSKNHYYFEMMRESCTLSSNEWYIPKNWHRPSLEEALAEKQAAEDKAEKLFDKLTALEGKIEANEFEKLKIKFLNLKIVTKVWHILTKAFIAYAKYFDTKKEEYRISLENQVKTLKDLKNLGCDLLGERFYCMCGNREKRDFIGEFTDELLKSFHLEREADELLSQDNSLIDYIICGGAMEGHYLKKEVNFSDTLIKEDGLCRIPGNRRGLNWSAINAHGWFSYTVKVKPNCQNIIKILMSSATDNLDVCVTIGNTKHIIHEKISGKKEFTFTYDETSASEHTNIRFDKISGHTPCIYTIKVRS